MADDDRGAAFRALHEGEPFVIPNPWDAGSAKVLHGLGFKALASTSSGFAFTLGRPDGGVTIDDVADHAAVLSCATPLPVAMDLEQGYGDAPAAIRRVAEAGAVGASLEDWDPGREAIDPLDRAAERVAAAAEAARAVDGTFTLTARAENHIRGNPDLDDTIARLQAYDQAGADVLYAPGLRSADEIRAVCAAVSKPVNVLALPMLTLDDIFDAGAQRVSVGGWLTWVAAGALIEAAEAIRDRGDLSVLRSDRRIAGWLGA